MRKRTYQNLDITFMKTNKRTKHLLLVLLFCFVHIVHVDAQVTIGSGQAPDDNAILDLKNAESGPSTKGLLLPRVELESTTSFKPLANHVAGMLVYNTATVGDVTPGQYYNDGGKWVRIATGNSASDFFYMPSIVLPTDITDPAHTAGTFTIDLHQKYSTQFATTIKSSTATLTVLAKDKLDYFVTYYDNTVFQDVQISAAGVLTYKLQAGFTITENTFMNIVFKPK